MTITPFNLQQELKPTGPLSQEVLKRNIQTWEELFDYVQHLSYGRTSRKQDLSLVLSEQIGSCSTKHALIRKIAIEQKVENIRLILGVYQMNRENTPEVDRLLEEHGLEYIPEAHAFLSIDGQGLDISRPGSDFKIIKAVLMEEQEITPQQIGHFKYLHHKDFIQKWLRKNDLPHSLEEIWTLREQIISKLDK